MTSPWTSGGGLQLEMPSPPIVLPQRGAPSPDDDCLTTDSEVLRAHLRCEVAAEMQSFHQESLLPQLRELFERQEQLLREHVQSVEAMVRPAVGVVDEARVGELLTLAALDGKQRESAEAQDALPSPAQSLSVAHEASEACSEQSTLSQMPKTLPSSPKSGQLDPSWALLSEKPPAIPEEEHGVASFPQVFSLRRNQTTTERSFEIEKSRVAVPEFLWPWLSPWVHWWYELEEPPRTGWLAWLVRHRGFDLCCEFVIAVNSAVIVYIVNTEAQTLEEARTPFLWTLNIIFVSFYLLEMLLKLAVYRTWFFCNRMAGWNLFDLCLVSLAVMDIVVEEVLSEGYVDVRHMRTIRSLRLVRAAKILRMFRLLRVFGELRLLLSCVLTSLVALFWGLVLLVFTLFVFGLIFVQGATTTRLAPTEHIPRHLIEGLETNWASTQRAMLVLFASVTGGNDWVLYYEEIKETGLLNTCLFVFFIAFGQFALLNILTATFVEHALKLAEPDRETAAFLRRKEEMQDMQELRNLCRAMDPYDTGLISEDYFLEHIKQEQFKARLALLGLDIRQATLFCDVIFTEFGAKELEIEVFVHAAMRLKGLATSLDLQAIVFGTRMIYEKLLHVADHVQQPARSPLRQQSPRKEVRQDQI